MTQHVAADDTYMFSYFVSKKQGGEYRKLPFKLMPKGMCSFINEDEFFFPELNKYSDINLPVPCPLLVVSLCSVSSISLI